MTILVVGDSFSAPNDAYVVWASQISQRVGLKVYNHAVNGTGYIDGDSSNRNKFTRQLHFHPEYNAEDIKLVIMLGSCNDRSHIPARLDYYRTMVYLTHREVGIVYPNAKHLVITPQWSGPNAKPVEIDTMLAAITEMMWAYDYKYNLVNPNSGTDVTNWWFPPDRPELWAADNFHPSQLGYTRMADKIEPHVRKLLGLAAA